MAPTRAAFIRRADAQCSKGNDEETAAIRAYAKEKHAGSAQSPEEGLLLAVVLPSIRENVERLGGMDAPSGDEGMVQAIVAADEKAIERAEADPSSALSADRSRSPFARGAKLSKRYGFKVCGQY